MKLNEIKNVNVGEYKLDEGVIPVHLEMALLQIINAGKVTNSVQHFILAGLSSMFKDGTPARWPRDINAYPMCTGTETIDAIKNLTSAESVELAKWLLASLQIPTSFEETSSYYRQMDLNDWVKLVLQKQD